MARDTTDERKRSASSARGERTPAGDAMSVVAVLVLRLAGHLTATGDALAKPAGQSSARWQVLAAVEDEAATVAAIARVLGLARQSVQRVADLLVNEGMARYVDNANDQRAMLLQLTARGRSALRTIQAAQRSWANALGAELGERELRVAGATLARVMDAVARQREDGE
ncbi:MAG: MarR family transcriptional regulator [Gemmatimonadetes bacterium]|nr:MarR family transcriptional regulator [Gemmatimonadota bacterium]